MKFFVHTETDEGSFPLLLLIIIVIVVTALLVIIAAIIIGIVHYKKRKQRRKSAKQEIEIPEYTEISSNSKDAEPHSQSQVVPIKMQKNVVYGVRNQLGMVQHQGGEGREYDVIQPQSPPMSTQPSASHAMMFRLNMAYGVNEQEL